MDEKKKLKEAKYFYYQMSKNIRDREIFTYNLSAFLTAARCVLQYSLKEAKSKIEGQKWYVGYINNDNVLNFFKDKRDSNIHVSPIDSKRKANINIGGELRCKGTLSAKVIKANGSVKDIGELKSLTNNIMETEAKKGKYLTRIRYEYFFNDWSGNENTILLCKKYLKKLDCLIKDGVKKGFITG